MRFWYIVRDTIRFFLVLCVIIALGSYICYASKTYTWPFIKAHWIIASVAGTGVLCALFLIACFVSYSIDDTDTGPLSLFSCWLGAIVVLVCIICIAATYLKPCITHWEISLAVFHIDHNNDSLTLIGAYGSCNEQVQTGHPFLSYQPLLRVEWLIKQ